MDSLDHDVALHTTPNAGDESLLVKFFIDAVKDEKASVEAARPIFKDVEWIDIRVPGNRDNIVIRPTRPSDITRFPRHYAAFKARVGTEQPTVGTPLSTWPWHGMTRSRVEEMRFFNVTTVEQLAAMSDNTGQKIMGFQSLKQAAVQYITTTKASAPIARLQALLEQALEKIDEQATELARLSAAQAGVPAPAHPVVASASIREKMKLPAKPAPKPKPKKR